MPIEVEGDTYFTAAEAARYLGVSRETFYRKSDLDKLRTARPIDPEEEGQ